MFEYNNDTFTLEELKGVAELVDVDFETFYNEGLNDGSIVEKTNDVAETGVPVPSELQAPESGVSPSDVSLSESQIRFNELFPNYDAEAIDKQMQLDIGEPSRQDNSIAAATQQSRLAIETAETKTELFEEYKVQHGDKSPDEVYADMYGANVFMEEVGTGTSVMPMPDAPTGFMLSNPNFWKDNRERETSKEIFLNRRATEEESIFNLKYENNPETIENKIVEQGTSYISLEDMDIASLRREGKIEEANKLAEERGYTPLLNEEGNITGFAPADVVEKAENMGESNEKETLLEMRKNAYFKLLATSKFAHENNQEGIHPYLQTLGDVTLGRSLIEGAKGLFGDEAAMGSVVDQLAKVNETGELVGGLHTLPSETATATAFNDALKDFVTINRALEVNANLALLDEESWFKEIVAPTNDEVVESFTGMMEANGFEANPEDLKRDQGWFPDGGIDVFGEEWTVRDIAEGGRDMAKHLAPLAASVWLTKKLPMGVGKKAKTLGTAISQRTNVLGRYLKGVGPQSRAYRNAVDLTLGGVKETVILAAADKPLEDVFGQDPFVYNEKTGDVQLSFPFALGFGNVAAAKILNKLNTTKNFFTPALAALERSKTATAAWEIHVGATVGTTTMWFAENVTKGLDSFANLGYESKEEMQQDHGFKNLVETYFGMAMFQGVSPAMGRNALSKLGRGMYHDITKAATGLTPRARKAKKAFGIEENKKGDFNLTDINNTKAQKIYEIRKDKNLDADAKKQEIEKIENQAEELIFHNELKLAKKLAKKEGKYQEHLTSVFDIANKMKSGQKVNASDVQRFSNLTDIELQFLKQKFNVTEGSEFSKMINNKRQVYKDILESVNKNRIHEISPEARNKQIELYLEQAEINGEIQALKNESIEKPHLAERNNIKIKKLIENQKLKAEELVQNEELYDKILKDKFETEAQFAKIIAEQVGVDFEIQDEASYVKKGGREGTEGRFVEGIKGKRDKIYINKDRALEVRQLGTQIHEITHAILKNSLKETYTDSEGVERKRISEKGKVIINQFLNKLSTKERAAVEKRMEQSYKYYRNSKGEFILKDGKKIERPKKEYQEEYLTAFGDVLKNKEVVETRDLADRVKDVIYPILQKAGFKNLKSISVDNGEGLYNMLKSLQKTSETGVVDQAVLDIATKGKKVTGKSLAESRTITEGQKEASARVDKIYKEKGLGGYSEIIDQFKGLDSEGRKVGKDFIEQWTKTQEGTAGYAEMKDILYDAMANDPVYGVLGGIMSYKPGTIGKKGKEITLAQHIFGRLNVKYIDIANKYLGKGEQRKFKQQVEGEEVAELVSEEIAADELFDIREAEKAKTTDQPTLRKSLMFGEQKGINEQLVNKVEETVVKTFGTKKIVDLTVKGKVGSKELRVALDKAYATELRKPVQDAMGKGAEYEIFLRDNLAKIIEFGDKSKFVQAERLLAPEDRVFSEIEIQRMSVEQTEKAIAERRVPKNTSLTAGNTLYKFKMPSIVKALKYYLPPSTKISPKKAEKWDKMSLAEKQKYAKKEKTSTLQEAKEKYITVGSGLKGTRKEVLADILGSSLAKDMTSQTLAKPEIIEKIKDIKMLEVDAELTDVARTLGSPEGAKLYVEGLKDMFEGIKENVAAQIERDPNQMFSSTEFKRQVDELQLKIEKSPSIEDVFDLKTGRPLEGKYTELAAATALNGWGEGYVRTAVNKLGGNKGTGYEVVTGQQAVKAAKAVAGLTAKLNVTERKIFLEEVGNFKGGKVQAPDLMVEVYDKQMSWELKFGDARAGKNNAGQVNFTEKSFNRTQKRNVSEHEAAVREAIQEAIDQAGPLEAKLRELGVLKPGEPFTSKTKVPLADHNIVNGKGGEKALVKSESVKVGGDFVADHYNGKGVFYMQYNKKNAMYLGSDPFGVAKELGMAKFEGDFILKARVYAASYKGADGKTAGYTYKVIAEPLITPKAITSKSTFSLDTPGAWKKLMNTTAMKELGKQAARDKVILKSNNTKAKQIGISESRTNKESLKNFKIVDKAFELGRKINKKSRGMSTFDFDETLIIKGKNFVTATKGKKVVKISSEKFPIEGPKLEAEGYNFDFKDFVNVKGGVEGPLFKKLQNQIAKYGNENVYVLTARMQEAAPAIQAWLKSKGVELPIENITGLGKSAGEAKALWMLEKFSEGYNDMYFVDDALPNVKAVKNVLNQLDIKSKVQQAYSETTIDKSLKVNDIIEGTFNIPAKKTFSKAEGKVRGKDIKRRRVFMPDTASDLELLLEPLYGKGKKGIENKKWFENNFVRKWERGVNDFNNARQAITNDYMSLRKGNKDVVKKLSEAVEGTNFTNDMAMRVYIWNKNGFKIPDLAKSSEQKLIDHVTNNPKLQAYAENLARLTKLETGLKKPSAEWWGETIAAEIQSLGEGVGRKKYIQDFIDAKNEIFSEANLNKMESKLGTNWRETIEDMFDRMETGRTRSMNLGKTGTAIMNYFNGSVGAIMNFNTRSGVLQLISTVNFVNSSFNNPLMAAKAFANQPQYWKDFMRIMNSDMLKQRRAGLEINVTEAELASATKGKRNPAKAALAHLLKIGFLPTKIADSFAISAGGATYYRNAINKYTKEGLSKAEAERKAFIDFQAIAERTQQSSRADLLSKQQTSFEGRLILPFANTPMQMNRIMVKDVLDISKGRFDGYYGEGSLTSKLSRIGYYGFAQSLIFAGLQSGAFALMTNSDDDKKIAESKLTMLNTVADSFLRGMGIQGAVINGFRLAIQEFIKQDGKKYNADYSEVAEKLLNISPTVGSKFSKLDAAGNTYKYNKKVIKEEGLTLNGPLMEASTQVIEATTNLPLNRYYKKGNNIQNAADDSYYNWQRVLMSSGWSNWGLGVGKDEERTVVVNKGKENEYTKYLTKEQLRRGEVEGEVKEKKKEEKKKTQQRCTKIKSDGTRCKLMVVKPKTRCHYHD